MRAYQIALTLVVSGLLADAAEAQERIFSVTPSVRTWLFTDDVFTGARANEPLSGGAVLQANFTDFDTVSAPLVGIAATLTSSSLPRWSLAASYLAGSARGSGAYTVSQLGPPGELTFITNATFSFDYERTDFEVVAQRRLGPRATALVGFRREHVNFSNYSQNGTELSSDNNPATIEFSREVRFSVPGDVSETTVQTVRAGFGFVSDTVGDSLRLYANASGFYGQRDSPSLQLTSGTSRNLLSFPDSDVYGPDLTVGLTHPLGPISLDMRYRALIYYYRNSRANTLSDFGIDGSTGSEATASHGLVLSASLRL